MDDILNIENSFFDTKYRSIYPPELLLNKTNTTNVRAPFLDLDITINNNLIETKIYDKRDDFNFDIINFPYLDGDVPRAPSYGIYISQLVRYARACSHVIDFNIRNLSLTEKILKQGYQFHKLRKTFAKFYHRNSDLLSKFKTSMKSLIIDGISHPEYYGDVMKKMYKIKSSPHFHEIFVKVVNRYIKRGYSIVTLRQTIEVVLGTCTVDRYSFLFLSHDDKT